MIEFWACPPRCARGRAAPETVAKMGETPFLPLRHATHSHYQMPEEGLLQRSASGFAELRLASLCEARPPLRGALRIPHATHKKVSASPQKGSSPAPQRQ